MPRKLILSLLLLLWASVARAQQPNLVFFMGDDLALGGVSAYGTGIAGLASTPNIDSIATDGVKFTNYFATHSICKPSRATALTGKWSVAHGVLNNDGTTPMIDQQTVADLLKAAGYATAVVGKWHLVTPPSDLGFDHYETLPLGHSTGAYNDDTFNLNGVSTVRSGYTTDLIGDYAISWIAATTPTPFAIFIWYTAPHDNFVPAVADETLHAATTLPHPVTFGDRLTGRSGAERANTNLRMYPEIFANWQSADYQSIGKPPAPGGMNAEQSADWIYQLHGKDYLRTIKGLDDSVGEVLAYLSTAGLVNDTVVIFASDHGFLMGEHFLTGKVRSYEESIRAPLMIRSPGEITPGTTDARVAVNADLAPTMLEFASIAIPSDIQGRSLVGAVPGDWRTAFYFHHEKPNPFGAGFSGYHAIRTSTKKLIVHDDVTWGGPPETELIDMSVDPLEYSDRSTAPQYQGAAGAIADLTCQMETQRLELGVVHSTLGVDMNGADWR